MEMVPVEDVQELVKVILEISVLFGIGVGVVLGSHVPYIADWIELNVLPKFRK